MKISLSPRAEKEFRKLQKLDQIAVARKIRDLGNGGKDLREEKLSGYRDIFRVRVGDFRIVFKKSSSETHIILIGSRGDVYESLKRLL